MKNSTISTLSLAFRAWERCADLRARRQRFKQYTYGNQWGDTIFEKGRYIREDDAMIADGGRPHTNNLIRRLVKSIVGRYRTIAAETQRYKGRISAIADHNHLAELDSRLLEEFLISGCALQRVSREPSSEGAKVRIDNVNPCHFFVDRIADPLGRDIQLVGMLHDMTLAEVLSRFAHGDPRRARDIRAIYTPAIAAGAPFMAETVIGKPVDMSNATDFFNATDSRCRVIEVWTLDCSERLMCFDADSDAAYVLPAADLDAVDCRNAERAARGRCPVEYTWDIATQWHCRWYAPTGELLGENDSPFANRRHPFVVKLYPLTDGEVHPFVEDIIDQQRYINRLISLIDKIIGSAAKGVLLFPGDQKMRDFTWEEIAKRWSATDGVIPITGKGMTLPQQIITPTSNLGAYNLLALEMKLFEDASGVASPILGKEATGTTGSELYKNQIQNATAALADIFETFRDLTILRDSLALQISTI